MKFGAGQPVRRLEDNRLITGKGEYADDTFLPGTAHMVLLRSPHAHAKILDLDTLAAGKAKGVIGVFTNKDIEAAGLKPIPCVALMPNKDGSAMTVPPRHMLAKDRVCHLGDPSPGSSPKPRARRATPPNSSASIMKNFPPSSTRRAR